MEYETGRYSIFNRAGLREEAVPHTDVPAILKRWGPTAYATREDEMTNTPNRPQGSPDAFIDRAAAGAKTPIAPAPTGPSLDTDARGKAAMLARPAGMRARRYFMELSTAHLLPSTRKWLDDCALLSVTRPLDIAHWVAGFAYGWFIYADEEPSEEDFPCAELRHLFAYARAHGCDYLLFDSDADAIEGLPTFDDSVSEGVSEQRVDHATPENTAEMLRRVLGPDSCALISDALDVLSPDDTEAMDRRDELAVLFGRAAGIPQATGMG